MKKLYVLLLALVPSFAFSQPATEDEGLQWIANELKVIRAASLELQSRQVQGADDQFEFKALQLDLTRIITEIEAKVEQRENPLYKVAPLEVEKHGY